MSEPSSNEPLKSQLMGLEIPSLARSLGIGGMLGILIAYLLCLSFPQLLIATITVNHALAFGAAFGVSTHRLVDGLIVRSMIRPIYNFASYYAKLVQLETQHRKGFLDEQSYKLIKNELDLQYFLGKRPNASTLLLDKP